MQYDDNLISIMQPNSAKAASEYHKIICEKEREKKKEKAESLQQHNELLAAINKISESCGNIIIGDNAAEIQIQQNSPNSSQNLSKTSEFDYKKVLEILNEIKSFTNSDQIYKVFDSNLDYIKELVDSTIKSAEKMEDETLIKKSLRLLKDLAMGASGSIIGSGIISLLNTLPI